MKLLGFLIAFGLHFGVTAQVNKKTLFLGNSYTYYNNLPVLIENLAAANGDVFIHDQNTPGGYTLQSHSTNATTLSKIQGQEWDYVVLQEQSQRPSFPPGQVATDVKPFASILNDSILANNSCSKTMFFMTWGRENGDASNCVNYTPLCTYEGMQGRLRESYLEMTFDNEADCAPVGVAWKKVREDFPSIDLYTSDGSHPSIYGSYLAACVFYSSMFQKTAVGNTYWATLDSLTAFRLQDIASSTVLDSLSTWSIETHATNFVAIDSFITSCDSVEVNGNWYLANTQFSDTISSIGSCAEIINYTISIGEETIDSVVNSCNSILLNGIEFEQDTIFSDSVYNPCLTIYNYNLNFQNITEITFFKEAVYVKTTNFGFNFMLNVQNTDSLFLYKDSVLIATYPSLENNLSPSFAFIDCYKAIEGTGTKTFILVAKNQCSTDSSTTHAICKDFWGALNKLENNNFQISPNPTTNFLEIETDLPEDYSVNLIDISGKILITNQKINQQSLKLNVSRFEKGIYFLIVYDKNNLAIGQKKVIID